jgi:hypothetical protein
VQANLAGVRAACSRSGLVLQAMDQAGFAAAMVSRAGPDLALAGWPQVPAGFRGGPTAAPRPRSQIDGTPASQDRRRIDVGRRSSFRTIDQQFRTLAVFLVSRVRWLTFGA